MRWIWGRRAQKNVEDIFSKSGAENLGLAWYDEESQGKFSIKTVLRIFSHMASYRWITFDALAMVFLGTFAALLEPRILAYAIDDAIVPKNEILLRWVGLVFILTTWFRILATRRQGYLFEVLGQRLTQDLRVELFSHVQRMPAKIFDVTPTGRLLTRVTNDIGTLSEMFSAGFVSMVSNGLLVLGILIWMLVLNPKLGLIAVSVFPVLVFFTVHFSRRLRDAYQEVRSRLSAVNTFLAENFSGMKTVHLFNRQSLQLKKFESLNERYAQAQTGSIRVFAYFQPMITLGAGISISLMVWYGGKSAYYGEIKIGILVAYFTYILSLFQPLRELADKWNVFLSGMTSAERIYSILELDTEMDPEEITRPAHAISNLKGRIQFEDVWFSYKGNSEWAVRNLSFEIFPGEKVGIVGHTGAGKSTLIGLILRFYDPQKGRILLDGRDIREFDLRDLRASIGLIQQDVFLFSGTFSENVTFWGEGKLEKLSDFSDESLGQKQLNERGSNLSMGERQVLAFARAMAFNPKVLVLDEATSNMDSHQEQKLQKLLEEMTDGKTGIFIAHRLATVQNADRILVLHQGQLVEQGRHLELLERGGLYTRLYSVQSVANRSSLL